jgi:hypothetical protein
MRYTIHVDYDLDFRLAPNVVREVFGSLAQYMIITSTSSTYSNKWTGSITVEVKRGFEKRVERLIPFI